MVLAPFLGLSLGSGTVALPLLLLVCASRGLLSSAEGPPWLSPSGYRKVLPVGCWADGETISETESFTNIVRVTVVMRERSCPSLQT